MLQTVADYESPGFAIRRIERKEISHSRMSNTLNYTLGRSRQFHFCCISVSFFKVTNPNVAMVIQQCFLLIAFCLSSWYCNTVDYPFPRVIYEQINTPLSVLMCCKSFEMSWAWDSFCLMSFYTMTAIFASFKWHQFGGCRYSNWPS